MSLCDIICDAFCVFLYGFIHVYIYTHIYIYIHTCIYICVYLRAIFIAHMCFYVVMQPLCPVSMLTCRHTYMLPVLLFLKFAHSCLCSTCLESLAGDQRLDTMHALCLAATAEAEESSEVGILCMTQ